MVYNPLTPRGLSLLQNFKIRTLEGISIFRGRLVEKTGDFLGRGWRDHSCYIKNKLKSELLNDKKKATNQNVYLP